MSCYISDQDKPSMVCFHRNADTDGKKAQLCLFHAEYM